MNTKLTPRYSVGDDVIDTTSQNKKYTIKDVINHSNGEFAVAYVLEDPSSGQPGSILRLLPVAHGREDFVIG